MIRLHHAPASRSMRVLWLLHELGVESELVVHGFDDTLWSEDYLKKSPAGRVPALELDGRAMFESGAMIEVLCERFPETGLGRPPGHAERVDWLQLVHFAETISQHTAALTQQHVFLFKDHMRSPTVMKVEAARLGKCFGFLDRLVATRDYVLASGFSAADIALGQAVYMARHFRRFDGFENLAAWYARLERRAGFQASLPKPGEPMLYDRPFYEAWPTT